MIGPQRKHTFGEPPPAKTAPRKYWESDAQRAVVAWIRKRPDWLVLRLENAAKRTPAQISRDKAMGLEVGAPDLIVIYKKHLLFLEMKSENGATSQEQDSLHFQLRAREQMVMTAYGHIDALNKLVAFSQMCDQMA